MENANLLTMSEIMCGLYDAKAKKFILPEFLGGTVITVPRLKETPPQCCFNVGFNAFIK